MGIMAINSKFKRLWKLNLQDFKKQGFDLHVNFASRFTVFLSSASQATG